MIGLGLLALGLALGIGIGAIALTQKGKDKVSDAVMAAADALIPDEESPPKRGEVDHILGLCAEEILRFWDEHWPEDDAYWEKYWAAEERRLSFLIKDGQEGE